MIQEAVLALWTISIPLEPPTIRARASSQDHIFTLGGLCAGECPTHSDRLGGVARLATGIQASTSTAQWSFGSTANVGPWRL